MLDTFDFVDKMSAARIYFVVSCCVCQRLFIGGSVSYWTVGLTSGKSVELLFVQLYKYLAIVGS